MFDMHCHLLYGIDDGPSTELQSFELARALVADGISVAVCTPHVFPGRFDNFSDSIEACFSEFVLKIRKLGIQLEIRWAGEVRLSHDVLSNLAKHRIPFLGYSDGYCNILLELPDSQVPVGAIGFVQQLIQNGIRPVIAHPERNRGIMSRIDRLAGFIESGCLVQVTAGSLVGQFGSQAQEVARELLQRRWVHAVASDAHNLRGRRPRMLDASTWISAVYGDAFRNYLLVDGPSKICYRPTRA